MIPIIDAYRNGGYDRPSTDISPKEKGDKYGLNWSRYLYSLYCSNQTSWGYDDVSRFNTNRLYSRGEQPNDQYKSWLLNEVNDSSSSTTPLSVSSWDDLGQTARGKRSYRRK